jgi:hypothetical protein
MPRPDKEINPGRLDGPESRPSRESWTKYGGPETADAHRGSSGTVEVTVDDITVTERPDDSGSKYTTRGTAAHGVGLSEEVLKKDRVEFVREWVIDRTVEGRTYRRTDKLIMVELSD